MDDRKILTLFSDPGRKEEAFSLLVKQYKERLYWHLFRMLNDRDDALDVLQETLVRVWRNLSSFRKDAQLYTWLYRIATNEALNHLKKNKRQPAHRAALVDEQLQNRFTAEPALDEAALEEKLKEAVNQLPVKQKQVFVMRYYDELKYSEISEILATSEGALKASYYHAVKKIEASLKASLNL